MAGARGAQIHAFDAHDLPDIIRRMRRYTDRRREMDFADASLYWLAIATGITEVMTVDETA